MPRLARIIIPHTPHHVTQRGNNRQDVFFVDDDRQFYLRILREQCLRHGVTLWGYCLMSNHVHLILVPEHDESLALAVGRTHVRYAQEQVGTATCNCLARPAHERRMTPCLD